MSSFNLKTCCAATRLSLLCGSLLLFLTELEHILAFGQLPEHLDEFVEGDLTVAIHVDLLDNILPDLLRICHVVAQNGCDFSGVDCATAVLVEEAERGTQVRLIQQLGLVDGRCTPFTEVYSAASIDIRLFKFFLGALINLILRVIRIQDAIRPLKLFKLDQSIAIGIELVEGISHGALLLLRGQMA